MAEPNAREVARDPATRPFDLVKTIVECTDNNGELYDEIRARHAAHQALADSFAEGVQAGREEAAKLIEDHGHSNGRIRASHKHLAKAIRAGATP